MPDSNRLRHMAPLIILAITAFILSLETQFGPFTDTFFGWDSSVYAFVAWSMKNGTTLYSGIWDNKGPLLYFLNLIGISIDWRHGIYVLELLGLLVTAFFAYGTAYIVTNGKRWIALLATLLSLMLLPFTHFGGNLPESWSLPFMSVALYLSVKYFYQEGRISWWETVLVGAAMCAVFMIRLNIGALFVPIGIVLIASRIAERRFGDLARTLGLFLLGAALLAAPMVIYLAKNGAVSDWVDASTRTLHLFLSPSKVQRLDATLELIRRVIPSGSPQLAVVFLASLPAYLWKSQTTAAERRVLVFSGLALMLTLWANSLVGHPQVQYFMPFIPAMVVPSAWIFARVDDVLDRGDRNGAMGGTLIVGLLVVTIGFGSVDALTKNIMAEVNFANHDFNDSVSTLIRENSAPQDHVQFFGMNASYYRGQDSRPVASRYPCFAAGPFTEDAIRTQADEIADGVRATDARILMYLNPDWQDLFITHLSEPDAWIAYRDEYYTQIEPPSGYDAVILLRR